MLRNLYPPMNLLALVPASGMELDSILRQVDSLLIEATLIASSLSGLI